MPEQAWDTHLWSWDEPSHMVLKVQFILSLGGAAHPALSRQTWLTSVKFPCPRQPLLPLPNVMIMPLSGEAESRVTGTREATQGTCSAGGWSWLPAQWLCLDPL